MQPPGREQWPGLKQCVLWRVWEIAGQLGWIAYRGFIWIIVSWLPCHPTSTRLEGLTKYSIDNDRICKLFIVYDSEKNPLRSLISLVPSDPILLKAVLALAAQHKANTGQQTYEAPSGRLTDAHHHALTFKHDAIHGLSQAVQDVELCRQDSTVASIFLLIFLDLLESGSDRWNVHVEGAKNLIALLNERTGYNPGQTVQGIRDFITKQIYLYVRFAHHHCIPANHDRIETLGATFVRPRLLSQVAPPDTLGQDTVEQSFLGCPGHLLNAIQYFSYLRDAIGGLGIVDTTDPVITRQVEDLATTLDSIQTFDCHLWASSLPHQSPTRNIDNLSALSTSYKLGAQIYGQRVLDALTFETTSQETLVADLLRVIASLHDDPFLFKCILWPICIAAVETPQHAHAQRCFLTECMEKFWSDTKCLNSLNAARIVQHYWEREEMEHTRWIFDMGFLGGDWLFI